jgi:hypothetical protein
MEILSRPNFGNLDLIQPNQEQLSKLLVQLELQRALVDH